MKGRRNLLVLLAVIFILSLGISKNVFAEGENPVDIALCDITFTQPEDANLIYTGNPLQPGIKVTYGLTTLSSLTDYDVTYSNNINAGKASIQVSARAGSNYTGVKTINFNILKADQVFTVSLNPQKLRLKAKSKVVIKGTTIGAVTYKSSKPAVASIAKTGVLTGKKIGKTKITIKAAGNANYNPRTVFLTVKVIGQELTKARTKITLSKYTYTYDGRKKAPVVTVKYRGKKLKKNRDYKVSYQNNVNAGKATVVVKGIKQYDGTLNKTFRIKKAKNVLVASISNNYVDLHKKVYVKVKKANGKITYRSDKFKVASVDSNGVVTGKKNGTCNITVTAAGDINHYEGSKKFNIKVGTRDVNDKSCKMTIAKKEIVYDGSPQLPYVNVTYDGKTMVVNRDYILKYSNNKNAGLATITMKGKGKYKGTRKLKFRIYKAYQTEFTASIPGNRIPLNGTAQVTASGYKGDLEYGCLSPTYVKNYKNGVYKGLKKTKDGITITVTASGDDNYRSKTIELWVQIN